MNHAGTASGGVVVAGTQAAAEAGATCLRAGGNATDAAVACALALAVTDPANCSVAGRGQWLSLHAGRCVALDGATVQRATEAGGPCVVPDAGLPGLLWQAHQQFGTLPWARVVEPAIALASHGFETGARLAQLWAVHAQSLALDQGAAVHLLRGGRAPAARTRFEQPALAETLRAFAVEGMCMADAHLATSWPLNAELVSLDCLGWRVVTVGQQGWGHSLVQLLGLLERYAADASPHLAPREELAEFVVEAIRRMYGDRPQHLGTLTPKSNALPLELLVSANHTERRYTQIREAMRVPRTPATATAQRAPDRDTTHLSTIDSAGNAVSLTCSIGPHFGARKADMRGGYLHAHSYAMEAHTSVAGGRDHTEMCPTIAIGPAGELLVLGAAGSERIPGAVAQVLFGVIARDEALRVAVADAPRIAVKDDEVRVGPTFDGAMGEHLLARGFNARTVGRDLRSHVGIVHAAMRLADGQLQGAADPVYDGAAAFA